MKSLSELEVALHSRYLGMLNLYRFIRSQSFQQAYHIATEEQKNIAEQLIIAGCKSKVVDWTKTQLKTHGLIEMLDMRYLRNLASDIGVKNYAILPRLMLIAAINGSRNGQNPTS